jgi:hypothetical protein
MKNLFLLLCFSILLCGCNVSPLSPRLHQQLDNQNGQIEDIKNNQNGLMLEIGKLRQESEIHARDIENAQQGILNLKGSNYSGLTILSGDGGLILVFSLAVFSILLIYHYRTRAVKSEKSAEILAQQIALYDDVSLDDNVFLSALNTDVEKEIYHLMVKSQAATGKRKV